MKHIYDAAYPETLIKLMSEGKSVTQVAAHFKIPPRTLYDWVDKYPEFAAAKDAGLTLAEAYWEELGQKGIKGVSQRFNAAAWMYYMKCRFKKEWAEGTQQKIELVDSVKK